MKRRRRRDRLYDAISRIEGPAPRLGEMYLPLAFPPACTCDLGGCPVHGLVDDRGVTFEFYAPPGPGESVPRRRPRKSLKRRPRR